MKRVLILGGEGMLGHKAYQVFSEYYETYVTFQSYGKQYQDLGIFSDAQVIDKVDAFDMDIVTRAIRDTRPEIVLNCIGIIKQREEAKNPRISIYINALFPHLVADASKEVGAKFIQVSTDCVFSGNKGNYTEEDQPDASDLYGRTKLLGEVHEAPALTLRTSIIGHEFYSQVSLVDWFLSQGPGEINGFTNAIYTGLPTVIFIRELVRVIENFPHLTGLYHVSSEKISKFRLLELVRDAYGVKTKICPYEDYHGDRSLDSTRYRQATGFIPSSWEDMVEEMYQDYTETKYRI